MTEQFVQLPDRGVALCIARSGEGPPLLVLGGTGSDLRNKPNPLQWPIAASFDMLAYDHRCLGRSEQSDPDLQPTMADFAADALALCDDQGFDTFSVIGISFGGMVAQELAILAGARVKRLVLCCTSSGGEGGASYPLHELYANGYTMDDIFGLRDIRAQYDRTIADQLLKILANRVTPDTPPPGLLKQVEARRHHDTTARLSSIVAPTLVAHGVYDGIAPPENSETLANAIPNAQLAPFVGGHPFLQQDKRAWAVIHEFLQDG